MTIALVGTVGPIAFASSSVTPTFAQPTTAGNLLVAFCIVNFNSTPATSSGGWSLAAAAAGTAITAAIFFEPNCGAAETGPTFTAGIHVLRAFLCEFSGATASSLVLDQTGTATGATASPITVTANAPDLATTDLVAVCSGVSTNPTVSVTGGFSHTNGYTELANNGLALNTAFLDGAYTVLTNGDGGVTADTDTVTSTLPGIQHFVAAIASFTDAGTIGAQGVDLSPNVYTSGSN
jgi:hypothetical protein